MRRIGFAWLAVVAVLVTTIGVLWVFGAPQPGSTVPLAEEPAPVAPAADMAAAEPGFADAEQAPPASAGVPEPDPNSPLAISIPGCKCHSDDPKLVKEHEGYRMNQCAGCHAGQVPTGQ